MTVRLLGVLAIFLAFTSCKKSNDNKGCGYTISTAVAPASEIANVQTYLSANNITATQHPSGLFYVINSQGSGMTPGVCSGVKVKYVGRLTNGNTFDDSNPNNPNGITFTLGQLISGWQFGIPLIKPGGSITLYIPPSLGYGSQGSPPSVPGNSILIFDIQLIDVFNQ